MKKKQNPLVWMLICAVLVSLSVGYFSVGAVKELSQTQTNWSEYTEKQKKIEITMRQLRAILGYGGFIHDFKNAVLRKDKSKYLTAYDKVDRAFYLLNRYESFNIGPDEKAALHEIRKVLTEYELKLGKVVQLIDSYAITGEYSAEAVDHLVKVDDTRAIKAFGVLSQAMAYRSEQQEMHISHSMSNTLAAVYRLIYILPVLIFLGVFGAVGPFKLDQIYKKSRETKRFYTKLFEHSPDAILLLSQQGSIIKTNKIAVALTGFSLRKLKKMSVGDLLSEEHLADFTRLRESCCVTSKQDLVKKSYQAHEGINLAIRHKEGEKRPVNLALGAIDNNGDPVIIACLRAIHRAEDGEDLSIIH